VQYVGNVETREGRLLTFPNILQYRVDPFRLADPSKPGHRKIIALFLVNPNIQIVSTAHVPCQQQGKVPTPHKRRMPSLSDLPFELQDKVLESVDNSFNLNHAKALRLNLMEERKKFVVSQEKVFEISYFGLCEH